MIDEGLDASQLLAIADFAMHKAKAEQRNSTLVQEHAVSQALEAADTARRAQSLRTALDGGQFVIEHQPLVALSTGATAGYEALIRLPGPERLSFPDEFLGLADNIGVMWEIDAWMTRQALSALADPAQPPIWVNLRASSIGHPTLARLVTTSRRSVTERLGFEISEQVPTDTLQRARSWFEELRAVGCRLALDDFGAGSFRLGALHEVPVDLVKIDRRFATQVAIDGGDRQAMRTLVESCHSLGVPVVAEGVETEAARRTAETLGADFGQGFLWPGRTSQL